MTYLRIFEENTATLKLLIRSLTSAVQIRIIIYQQIEMNDFIVLLHLIEEHKRS